MRAVLANRLDRPTVAGKPYNRSGADAGQIDYPSKSCRKILAEAFREFVGSLLA